MKIKKRTVICFGIFFVLFLMTVGNAAFPLAAVLEEGTRVRIVSNEATRTSLDIQGDRIIWADDRNEEGQTSYRIPDGNWDIYMYNLSTSTETQISDNNATQFYPVISGDRIVWQDNRNGNWDIYMYDLSTSEEIQISANASNQTYPAIYEDNIVWQDERNGNRDIYMYNLSTSEEIQITASESNQTDPAIYEDKIVWVEEVKVESPDLDPDSYLSINNDIYVYDLPTSTETQLSSGLRIWNPSIYGDRILWEQEDFVGNNNMVIMYDLSTSTETLIAYERTAFADIYEDRIVWSQDEWDFQNHVYMYNVSTSTQTEITADGVYEWGSGSFPAIDGDRIVWVPESGGIYMFTLASAGPTPLDDIEKEAGTETQITTNESRQYAPTIYGDNIMWRDGDMWGDEDKIYIYNISTSSESQISSSWYDYSAIYGDRIVWVEDLGANYSIYMYNLSTSTETPVVTGDHVMESPAIYGDRIVWTDYRNAEWWTDWRNSNYDIYMYDLSTSTETRITTNNSTQGIPAIYEDRIVWEDNRNGNWDIYMYNLSTSTETQITTNEFDQGFPDIYGDRIVWVDDRSGRRDIYMYNLSTSRESRITTNGSVGSDLPYSDQLVINDWGPAIYGDRIVWEDVRNGNGDIYMFTLASDEVPVQPVADFSANTTSGNAPLSVLFTDLSQYATGRSWDVNGDGVEDSNEASFVYTYSSRGTYEAKLTAINEYGTDTKTVTIEVERKSSGGSSGGGGGGGGGGSPEPARNVEVKELAQVFITNGKEVKFDFNKNATCVVYVGFDAKKNAGKTTTIVEQLKGKSALVSDLPEGEVYKSFNVWVGNSGYATSKNIENPVICFKVEKSWLRDKSIDQASIALNRYSDKEWEKLPVTLSGEDDTYLYFTAQVPGFSSFAITGEAKSTGEENDSGTKLESESRTINDTEPGSEGVETEQQAGQEESTSMPGFGMAFSVAGLLTVFLYKRK